MSNKSKKIELDLFKPYFIQTDENGITRECAYDLSPFLKHVSKISFTQTKRKIYGDNHMFHKCVYYEDKKIWELQILHLREQILPGIADDGGTYELIRLNDNQYPAESTTAIYDEIKNILYVQRNIYGTSIRCLTALIQHLSPEGVCVSLKALMYNSAITKIKDSNFYRKIILTVDSEQLTEKDNCEKLRKIISNFSEYSGKIITINLGFGKKRKSFLNKTDAIQLLKEAYYFSGTEKLVASMSESEDGKCENVDLLDDREKIVFEMQYSRENPITHERIYNECLSKI